MLEKLTSQWNNIGENSTGKKRSRTNTTQRALITMISATIDTSKSPETAVSGIKNGWPGTKKERPFEETYAIEKLAQSRQNGARRYGGKSSKIVRLIMAEDGHEKFRQISEKVISPLYRQKRFSELRDRVIEILDSESDPDLRKSLMSELAVTFYRPGWVDESRKWAHCRADEYPEDPHSWSYLAHWYLYSDPEKDGIENGQEIGLKNYKIALQKARESNEWVRSTLFDICRALTHIGDYKAVEKRMREILKDLEIKREIDVPFLECDWLEHIPEGKIDLELAEEFLTLNDKDKERIKKHGHKDSPPTLDDLK